MPENAARLESPAVLLVSESGTADGRGCQTGQTGPGRVIGAARIFCTVFRGICKFFVILLDIFP